MGAVVSRIVEFIAHHPDERSSTYAMPSPRSPLDLPMESASIASTPYASPRGMPQSTPPESPRDRIALCRQAAEIISADVRALLERAASQHSKVSRA